MINFDALEGFDWDEGNATKSTIKHGVNPSEAEQVFFNEPLFVSPDLAHSKAEPRYQALGITSEGRRLHVTFTLRNGGTLIRVISARDMHVKERKQYAQDH